MAGTEVAMAAVRVTMADANGSGHGRVIGQGLMAGTEVATAAAHVEMAVAATISGGRWREGDIRRLGFYVVTGISPGERTETDSDIGT
jgi:hypothetical protein